MNLVIMIPAFNEGKFIGKVVNDINQVKNKNLKNYFKKISILVINDGSNDDTLKRAEEAGADKIVSHKKNEGLGFAFKTGIENALKKHQASDEDKTIVEADEQTIIEKVLSQKKKGKWSGKSN